MSSSNTLWIDLEQNLAIGTDTYLTSVPPGSTHGVAFEDDLDTGYFYAFRADKEFVILDGLHIYNVADVKSREIPRQLKIVWTKDNGIASLLINDYCQAIFNFKTRSGYCRNGFPDNRGEWRQTGSRLLTDELIMEIFPE